MRSILSLLWKFKKHIQFHVFLFLKKTHVFDFCNFWRSWSWWWRRVSTIFPLSCWRRYSQRTNSFWSLSSSRSSFLENTSIIYCKIVRSKKKIELRWRKLTCCTFGLNNTAGATLNGLAHSSENLKGETECWGGERNCLPSLSLTDISKHFEIWWNFVISSVQETF